MVRIACLHTAQSNAGVFDAAAGSIGRPGVVLRHCVRADLLAAAEAAGGLTPEIAAETVAALLDLSGGADVVLLTCSTLGPAVEGPVAGSPVPMLRVDAALAEAAVAGGGTVTVLCATTTTLAPTRQLFEAAAVATGAVVTVQLVPGAWAAFKGGDRDCYTTLIAQAVVAARQAGADRVALAQASMAGAGARLPAGERPFDSPATGLIAARAAVGRRQNRAGT